ncbi:DUF614 domain protein [Talaromyces stipitatus ATCC 10500]|uniref:DUF614 domain protein n=1 Tax=Talaromyces stipitatus (strain ATCC 10500 / CBS 375.48 / QM 6759 / NRRL 1006) TaxID=441959 RepID=B8LYD8_TALSN|nr:DUF614 domain protein [Talaromyces stipitatus ATCC 10500]EED22867.1 DUF614 domain protein [Talaromyces stipitatus ATCC 10500]
MSRQPRLDTSLRQQVYSYVETPIELSPPGSHPPYSSDATTDQTTVSNDQTSSTNPSREGNIYTSPDAVNIATQELQQARQTRVQEKQALALSTTNLTEHPALSAPYTEGNTSITNLPTHASSQYQSPPYSPGPLPEKRHADFEYSSPQKISITPDTNPLQSPRSPIHRMGTFPSINQQSQAVHESFPDHHPGQIAHANQIDSASALMSELVVWASLARAFSTAERSIDYCANLEEKTRPIYWDTKLVTDLVHQWQFCAVVNGY